MTPLKSQTLGLCLGFATAVGCIAYEKIVKNYSYVSLWIFFMIEMAFLLIAGNLFFKPTLQADYSKFIANPMHWFWAGLYICTGVTSLLWYKITTEQDVMVGSIYEVKYIVMMALLYIAFGDGKFTWNTAVGVILALGSIYFISKN